MVFAEQTGRAVETIDLILKGLVETPTTNAGTAFLSGQMAGVRQISALAITDAAGTVVQASHAKLLGALPPQGLKALALHRPAGETGLRISEPLRDGNGRWTALVTRRRTAPDGGFAGIVVATMNLAYFEDFYEAVELKENGSILLHRRDGIVLARFPRGDGIIGTSYANQPPFADILARGMAGTVEMPSPVDGSERIVAIRALRAFPLAVSVSVGEDEVLATWWNDAWLSAARLAGGVALAGILLILSKRARDLEMAERFDTVERLAQAASSDPLTGLLNRTTLTRRFEALLSKARTKRTQVALLFLDLDGFKPINDVQGHRAGDSVLRVVANRISRAAESAQVARWGGDEFVVVTPIPVADSPEVPPEIMVLAESILRQLSAPIEIDGQTVRVGATIGVARFPQDGTNPDALVTAADAALYAGKLSGGNTIRVYDPAMADAVAASLALQRDLLYALETDGLSLNYQPIVQMPEERCVAFETLIRWHHPTRGTVPPSEFIPVAEQSGLIGRLGQWVLRRACEDAVNWPEHAGAAVSVNVSMAQIISGILVQDVAEALGRSGLPPQRLHLELTESMVGSDHLRIVPVLQTLHGMGIRIALDDFGTGFSSLSRLRTWPIDIVKIDQSFVQGMRTDGTAVIRATLLVAREYGLTVTVEGVETIEQWKELAGLGVCSFQGYLFCHPLEANAVSPWLDVICAPKPQRKLGFGWSKAYPSATFAGATPPAT